jgi:hypothetical protein
MSADTERLKLWQSLAFKMIAAVREAYPPGTILDTDGPDAIRRLRARAESAERDRDARAREACTFEGRTGCSFARPEALHTDHPLRHWDRTCPACIADKVPTKANVVYCYQQIRDCLKELLRLYDWRNEIGATPTSRRAAQSQLDSIVRTPARQHRENPMKEKPQQPSRTPAAIAADLRAIAASDPEPVNARRWMSLQAEALAVLLTKEVNVEYVVREIGRAQRAGGVIKE